MNLENKLGLAGSLDLEKELNESLQKYYFNCLDKNDLTSIEDLRELTGIEPKFSEEILKESYKKILTNICPKYNLERLEKLTNIKPKFSEEFIQELYTLNFEKSNLREIKEIKESTGIKPKFSKETIKKGLSCLLNKGHSWEFNNLTEIVEIEPEFSEEDVKKAYERFSGKSQEIKVIEDIQNLTKTKIPEELIQKGYQTIFRRGWGYEEAKEMQEITGVGPKLSEEEYVYFIKNSLENGRVKEFCEVSGDIPENIIQDMYSKFLYKKEFRKFRKLMEGTGIKPLENLAQEHYKSLSKEGDFFSLEYLIQKTEIKPKFSKEEIQEGYDTLLREGYIQDAIKYQKIFSTPLSKKNYKTLISFLSKDKELKLPKRSISEYLKGNY